MFQIHALMQSPEDGTPQRSTLRTFDVDVEPELVKAFFYVEPELEPQPVRRVKIVFHVIHIYILVLKMIT